MSIKEKKPKKPFMSGYKTYDPSKEGFGSKREWRGSFEERMGLDEAKEVIADGSPYDILGVTKTATLDEIKKAFRKLAMQHHPDKGGDPAIFRKVRAAFEVLSDLLS